MRLFKKASLDKQVEAELAYTERQLLLAEADLENAQGRRDTLVRRRDRLVCLLRIADAVNYNEGAQ